MAAFLMASAGGARRLISPFFNQLYHRLNIEINTIWNLHFDAIELCFNQFANSSII